MLCIRNKGARLMEDKSRETIKRLRNKYSLKTNTPFQKLPKIMTPKDYSDYMEATMYPRGKPSKEAEKLKLLEELFRPRF